MIIKSVKLENIRSYVNNTIEFPSGSVLLSGDIGSGKSSILLAIEFALFGVRKSELDGNLLLRHGSKSGGVELNIDVDGNDIIIKRGLKKAKEAIQQEAGYIVVNGVKKSLMPVELKSEIINLLGYPRELLAKSKNLIYRYTVYTPQEQMKQILFGDEEESRIDTLRKIFGIDRYKRIRENAQYPLREIKGRRKELARQIEDLEAKRKEFERKNSELNKLNEELKIIIPEIENKKTRIGAVKELLELIESNIRRYNELKRMADVEETKLNEKRLQEKRISDEIKRYENEIKILKEKIERIIIEDIKEDEISIEEEILRKENELNRIKEQKAGILGFLNFVLPNIERLRKDISEKEKRAGMIRFKEDELKKLKEEVNKKNGLIAKMDKLKEEIDVLNKEAIILQEKNNISRSLKENIVNINICPTCRQNVSKEHKSSIHKREEDNIIENEKKIKKILAERDKKLNEFKDIEKNIEIINNKERIFGVLENEIKNLQDIFGEIGKNKKIISGFAAEKEIKEKELKGVSLKDTNALQKDIAGLKEKVRRVLRNKINLKEKESALNILRDKEERLQNSVELRAENEKIIKEIENKKDELSREIISFKGIEEGYHAKRKEIDRMISEENDLNIKKVAFENNIKSLDREIKMLDEEIKLREKWKEKINYLAELQNWIEENLIPLMHLMEKHVMQNIHFEFNELFQKWFGMLMEDSNINSRIDENFNPIIEQNGYETAVDNLSGGEKTAAALAYRLALNKVINDVMVGIKTKDLIILDEPTDGFSSEQLDKVREVLDELNIKQIIIVSHESKVEGFVDNIIRINKNEHVSCVG